MLEIAPAEAVEMIPTGIAARNIAKPGILGTNWKQDHRSGFALAQMDAADSDFVDRIPTAGVGQAGNLRGLVRARMQRHSIETAFAEVRKNSRRHSMKSHSVQNSDLDRKADRLMKQLPQQTWYQTLC
jgi:hypothetical protein